MSKPEITHPKALAGMNAWKMILNQLEQQAKDIQELKDRITKLEEKGSSE